ncbi:MAG: hypothetical protein KatS3mg118_3614 [Paracoccaceae bacterium]|nr:MAG: hypothetical protein KatS3mg118_3614 [Paracoccaceae bacterium]
MIGIGHGRTIAAAVNALGRVDMTGMRVVSMLGGLTRSFAANPYDVIHSLARRGAADAYMLPAPMFADSADDKQVMLGPARHRPDHGADRTGHAGHPGHRLHRAGRVGAGG